MVAVGPSIVVTAVMFLVRPTGSWELLLEPEKQESSRMGSFILSLSEVEDEKSSEERISLYFRLVKADFWLGFYLPSSSIWFWFDGFDNLGQISQSLGYAHHVFVSMISIWNFLGRVAGGYFSENIIIMHTQDQWQWLQFKLLWHLLYSSIIWGIYDYQAKQQHEHRVHVCGPGQGVPLVKDEFLTCYGSICYSLTMGIMSGLCIIAFILSMIVVHRTKRVYAQIYGKPQA
ncbi:hypothetical protein HAX54_051423 [Datura stramonium]|uniref:Uncharacterized protein n=1 Tax=Datura stramonium TaxID=4076 RepID=A0ABS8WPL4_DATST|nr:hypothetical protein [Datura stramonium]